MARVLARQGAGLVTWVVWMVKEAEVGVFIFMYLVAAFKTNVVG